MNFHIFTFISNQRLGKCVRDSAEYTNTKTRCATTRSKAPEKTGGEANLQSLRRNLKISWLNTEIETKLACVLVPRTQKSVRNVAKVRKINTRGNSRGGRGIVTNANSGNTHVIKFFVVVVVVIQIYMLSFEAEDGFDRSTVEPR